jgi:Uma2 family endonuclease
MITSPISRPKIETLRDLVDRLGGIPLERVQWHPALGTATEADVLVRPDGQKRLVELVDGVLVEKPMGYYESLVAGVLIQLLRNFLDQHPLGIVLAPDGPYRLVPGLVRLPDVSFVSWEHFPNRRLPAGRVLGVAPDLAVEVLSEGNTEAEMERKLNEYFDAGVQIAWLVDPKTRTAQVYTSPLDFSLLSEEDALDGGALLPGFRLSLRELLERAGPRDEE